MCKQLFCIDKFLLLRSHLLQMSDANLGNFLNTLIALKKLCRWLPTLVQTSGLIDPHMISRYREALVFKCHIARGNGRFPDAARWRMLVADILMWRKCRP
jgi:hypothetical protein